MKDKMFDTLRYVAVTPDGLQVALDPSTQYVTESGRGRIMHYPVDGDIWEWMLKKEREIGVVFIPLDLKGRILPDENQDTETD